MPEGHGLTIAEWHAMIDVRGDSLHRELLDGEPVARAPMSEAHADCVIRMHQLVEAAIGEAAVTQMHLPVMLDERSEPRPDVSVVARPGELSAGIQSLLLVVEVADSNAALIYGRGRKASYYARSGVPDCWIVDLMGQQILAHSTPASGGYREIRNLRPGATLGMVSLPGVALDVAELLGHGQPEI